MNERNSIKGDSGLTWQYIAPSSAELDWLAWQMDEQYLFGMFTIPPELLGSVTDLRNAPPNTNKTSVREDEVKEDGQPREISGPPQVCPFCEGPLYQTLCLRCRIRITITDGKIVKTDKASFTECADAEAKTIAHTFNISDPIIGRMEGM